MEFRPFGDTGKEFSALGFGAMRLPVKNDNTEIDEAAALEMMGYAFDQGVNYVDTAYGYHGGNSERVVSMALDNGYRDKVSVATKLPLWEVKAPGDPERLFSEQLARLNTERVEVYLLHCVQEASWRRLCDLGVLEWLDKAKADGRVGQIGFSFHDDHELFTEVIDAHDWDCCQMQYNYANEDVQAGTAGLQYAAAKGIAVVVMEPLLGGSLVTPSPEVRRVWEAAGQGDRIVDLALQWCWNKPEVALVLSGMSNMEQTKANVASACESGVGRLTAGERDLIARVYETYSQASPIDCTKCGYCMPCPSGVNIPLNFQLYNDSEVYKGSNDGLNRNLYGQLPTEEKAESCTGCRECEEKCPQQLSVSELMPKVHERMS